MSSLIFALGCGEREAPRRAQPRPGTDRASARVDAPPPPPQLARGSCRVARTTAAPAELRISSTAQAAFDDRGGLLVYLEHDGAGRTLAYAATISAAGDIGEPAPLGWQMERVHGVWRVGERFVAVLQSRCEGESACVAAGVIDARGRAIGAPVLGAPGLPSDVQVAAERAIYVLAGDRRRALALDRFDVADDGAIARRRVTRIAAPADPDERQLGALAVSEERWAVLVRETQRSGRHALHASTLRAPVPLFPPVPRVGGADFELHFAGDRVELAGITSVEPPREPAAWIMELSLEGRVLSGPLRLAPDDTFAGNRVTGADDLGRLVRRDALGRPIGEPLRVVPDANGPVLVFGADRRFLVLHGEHGGRASADVVECEAGEPPRPAVRAAFELPPDPRRPCGAVACTMTAPDLPSLLREIARECDARAFEGRAPPAGRDTAMDGQSVVHTGATGDATILQVATLECSRSLSGMGETGRWAFLAARTASGWTACTLDGWNSDYFDFELEVGEVRLESWLAGAPPELVASVAIGIEASDAGEISSSREENLHVCGMQDDRLVCWGQVPLAWDSREGSDGIVESSSTRWRVQPDGRGVVSITREGTPPETIRRAVQRLRPGCPNLPGDPR